MKKEARSRQTKKPEEDRLALECSRTRKSTGGAPVLVMSPDRGRLEFVALDRVTGCCRSPRTAPEERLRPALNSGKGCSDLLGPAPGSLSDSGGLLRVTPAEATLGRNTVAGKGDPGCSRQAEIPAADRGENEEQAEETPGGRGPQRSEAERVDMVLRALAEGKRLEVMSVQHRRFPSTSSGAGDAAQSQLLIAPDQIQMSRPTASDEQPEDAAGGVGRGLSS